MSMRRLGVMAGCAIVLLLAWGFWHFLVSGSGAATIPVVAPQQKPDALLVDALLPRVQGKWDWEGMRARFNTMPEKAKAFADRYKEQFKGVRTIHLINGVHPESDFDGLEAYVPTGGGGGLGEFSYKTEYYVQLNPFAVYERAVLYGYDEERNFRAKPEKYVRVRITTPEQQTIRVVKHGNTVEESKKAMMAPDPYYLDGLPGLAPLFSWGQYGLGYRPSEGLTQTVRNYSLPDNPQTDVKAVMLQNLLGGTQLLDWPKPSFMGWITPDPLAGKLVVSENVVWNHLNDYFRSERADDWAVYGAEKVPLPQHFLTSKGTRKGPGDEVQWEMVCESNIEFAETNVPIPQEVLNGWK